MKAYRYFTLAVLAGSFLAVLTPSACAQTYDAKMKVTFSGPVEVPGTVLPGGSYVFESMDSAHLTRILSADESKVIGTFFTMPDDRGQPADHSVVSWEKARTEFRQKFTPGSCPAIPSATNSYITNPVSKIFRRRGLGVEQKSPPCEGGDSVWMPAFPEIPAATKLFYCHQIRYPPGQNSRRLPCDPGPVIP